MPKEIAKIHQEEEGNDMGVINSYGNIDREEIDEISNLAKQNTVANEEVSKLASADYESEELKNDLNKKLLEQRIFEERQEAKRQSIKRAFMSDYEKEREKILLERRANGNEEVLNDEDIERLVTSQKSVNDRVDVEKEKILLAKRKKGEGGELSEDEKERLEDLHSAYKKLNAGNKSRQNKEIAKQVAIGAASLPASMVGLRSIYSIPTYLRQRFGVRGFLGKGGLGESIEDVISASQQTHQRIESDKKIAESEMIIRAESKLSEEESDNKNISESKKHTEVKDSITDLNKRLKMTQEGSVRKSEQRDLIAKLLWENRQKKIDNEEQRQKEITKILDDYTTTKIKGVEVVRDTVDSALVGVAATGVGIPAALGARVINNSISNTVERYQTKSQEARRKGEKVKILEDVVKGAIVENCQEMFMKDVKGKKRSDFQKKLAAVAAWGKFARTAALVGVGLNPDVFDRIIHGTIKAIGDGKVTISEATENFEKAITYQADRLEHLAEKTGEVITAGLGKGGEIMLEAIEPKPAWGGELKDAKLGHSNGSEVVPAEVVKEMPSLDEASRGLTSNFKIELGNNGVPAQLERVCHAISANSMNDVLGENGIFDEEEGAKSLNMAANLVKIIESDPQNDVFSWDPKTQTLEIKDYTEFNKILNDLHENADELWQQGKLQVGATAYLDDIKQTTWLKDIVHADGLTDQIPGHDNVGAEKITDFSKSQMVDDAEKALGIQGHGLHQPSESPSQVNQQIASGDETYDESSQRADQEQLAHQTSSEQIIIEQATDPYNNPVYQKTEEDMKLFFGENWKSDATKNINEVLNEKHGTWSKLWNNRGFKSHEILSDMANVVKPNPDESVIQFVRRYELHSFLTTASQDNIVAIDKDHNILKIFNNHSGRVEQVAVAKGMTVEERYPLRGDSAEIIIKQGNEKLLGKLYHDNEDNLKFYDGKIESDAKELLGSEGKGEIDLTVPASEKSADEKEIDLTE